MKNLTVYKYINIVSSFLLAILMLIPWFTISAMGTVESHSFMTIPALLNEGAEFLTQIGGKTLAITVLLLAGVLEYMCIVVAALGIWGGVRFMFYDRKSRLVSASQIVAASLMFIGIVAIVMIDYISATMLGGIVKVIPTFGFLAGIIFLAASIIGGVMYSKKLNEYYGYDEGYDEEYEEEYDDSYSDEYDGSEEEQYEESDSQQDEQ